MKKFIIPITLILMPYLILLLLVFMEEALFTLSIIFTIVLIIIANLIYAFLFPKIIGGVV